MSDQAFQERLTKLALRLTASTVIGAGATDEQNEGQVGQPSPTIASAPVMADRPSYNTRTVDGVAFARPRSSV